MWIGGEGRIVDNEPADAMASRLLKAFFDAPDREKGQGTEARAKIRLAETDEPRSGIELPPAS